MEITELYKIFQQYPNVVTDSRKCMKGSIFFALKGDKFNGNAFAAQALEKGCSYAVVDEAEYAVPGDSRYILVEDVLVTLQKLAAHHRRQLDIKVIGITGTNGKTTTKELIATVLSEVHNVLYTQGNMNNHIGVPLTLLQLSNRYNIAVIEMGANHPGEIAALTRIADPDFGIITNVGKAHLEGFGSFEGVLHTKGELYDYLRCKSDSTIFINKDNTHLTGIAGGLLQIPYGTQDGLYVNGDIVSCDPFLKFRWKSGRSGEYTEVNTHLIGSYNLENALAAVTVGRFFGVDPQKIKRAIESYVPSNNRSQFSETGHNKLVIDAYNANPTSMMAALKNFAAMNASNKMLIIGDMRELGVTSGEEHQKIVDFIKDYQFDDVVLVGRNFAATEHNFRSYQDVEELMADLRNARPEGKTILIKGSNGTHLDKIIGLL